jgi:hypothetical protein
MTFASRSAAWTILLVLASALAAPAQTTFATITGSVTDPTGAAVPDVRVTARHTATGIETVGVSNEEGVFTIAQLREGGYTVRANKTGFNEFVVQDIQLAGRDIRRVNVMLQVGSVETVVEVKGGATLVETETARISDTRDVAQLRDMPLNSRAIWAQLSLVPNVLQASSGSTIRFSGSRTNQSYWSIDGTSMSDGVTETQIGPLANYVESFQEIRIDSSNNTAEFGTIGQVTMITKSGTNSFHGSLFDYYSTPWFRARSPFAPARPTGISHLPGGSAGGPVYIPKVYDGRNRTFVFGSFETFRGSVTTQSFNPNVPLTPWRSGDFSGVMTPVIDPQTRAPFPGNQIPASRINPTALALQNRFYPVPNFGPANSINQNYRENRSLPAMKQDYYMIRGDHRFSDKDSVMGRYTLQDFKTDSFTGTLPTIPAGYAMRKNHAATIAYTRTFSPTVINEFRWGIATNNLPIFPPISGSAFVQEFGIRGLAPDLPDVPGILNVSFAGLALTNISQGNFRNPGATNHIQNVQDHVSFFRGRHNIKVGFNLARAEADNYGADANLFGNLQFSNRYTGHPYADFLLGLPSTAARSFPPLRLDRSRWQYDFFYTDDFKVNSRLSINYGIRYEYHPGWREDNGYLSTFDIGSGSIVVQDGSLDKVSRLFPANYVPVVEASSLDLPGNTIVRTDRNNFAPRLGIAYRPWGNNTVLRGGFGIYYDVVPRELTMAGVPFVLNEPAFNNPANDPVVILPNVFPAAGTGGPTSVSLPAAVNPDLQMPYSMQYSLTIEHARWDTGFRASYIGTNTRQGEYSYNYNSPVPDARPFIEKPRPFPQYPAINYFTNGAGHQFHSLTTEVERRMARGLQFQSSWVWARDIGDLERGQALENPFDRERERSVAPDIPTHRFTTNWIYQLPFGKGRPFLGSSGRAVDLILGGWDISGIYSYYSGQFLTPLWTGPDPTGTAFTTSATRPVVTIRPDHLRDANLPGDQRSINRWFDAGAFAAPPVGRFGNAAKGVIKGPHVNVWHIGFFKSFNFTERVRMRYEVTSTNFFNHPNYSNPATNISQAGSVGVINSVGGVNGASTGDQPGARAFRMGLRLDW